MVHFQSSEAAALRRLGGSPARVNLNKKTPGQVARRDRRKQQRQAKKKGEPRPGVFPTGDFMNHCPFIDGINTFH